MSSASVENSKDRRKDETDHQENQLRKEHQVGWESASPKDGAAQHLAGAREELSTVRFTESLRNSEQERAPPGSRNRDERRNPGGSRLEDIMNSYKEDVGAQIKLPDRRHPSSSTSALEGGNDPSGTATQPEPEPA